MAIQIKTHKNMEELMPGDKLDICQRCRNVYILIWLAEGEDYNDFGLRYCPFCGLLTDGITGNIIE